MSLDEARHIAADLRATRHEVLAAVTRGDLPPAGFAADPRVADVKLVTVAEVVPGVGKVRARRILDELGLAGDSRWADVAGDDQRRLVEALTAAGGPPGGGP